MQSNLKMLQILRGVAATTVAYFHTFANPHFGRFGVDIFFVISGMVMGLIVDRGQSAGTFALHRIIRIVPLYWLVTTAFVLAARVRPDLAAATDPTMLDFVRSLAFIPYFKEDGTLCPIITVGWTLNYEMFFYACILISILVSRRNYQWITAGLLLGAYMCLGKLQHGPVSEEFFGNSIVFEFLFGLILFDVCKQRATTGPPALLICAAGIAYAVMALTGISELEDYRLLVYGVPAAALVYFVVGLEKIADIYPRSVSVLTALGDASYATYLTHYFVIQSVKKILIPRMGIEFDTPLAVGLTLAAVLAVGQLVYHLIDQPLTRGMRRITARLAWQWPYLSHRAQ